MTSLSFSLFNSCCSPTISVGYLMGELGRSPCLFDKEMKYIIEKGNSLQKIIREFVVEEVINDLIASVFVKMS